MLCVCGGGEWCGEEDEQAEDAEMGKGFVPFVLRLFPSVESWECLTRHDDFLISKLTKQWRWEAELRAHGDER